MKKNSIVLLIFGFISIILGIFLLTYNYIIEKKHKAFETINFSIFDKSTFLETDGEIEELVNDETTKINTENEEPAKEEKETITYNYVGILEIPKINLKKGFLDMDSPYNNIEKNVTVIAPSVYPNGSPNNFILAAHNGYTAISYFRNLDKLSIGDKAIITYNNKKYTYHIVKIYDQEKTGTVKIYRDHTKQTLTLVTCKKDSRTQQTIYLAEI